MRKPISKKLFVAIVLSLLVGVTCGLFIARYVDTATFNDQWAEQLLSETGTDLRVAAMIRSKGEGDDKAVQLLEIDAVSNLVGLRAISFDVSKLTATGLSGICAVVTYNQEYGFRVLRSPQLQHSPFQSAIENYIKSLAPVIKKEMQKDAAIFSAPFTETYARKLHIKQPISPPIEGYTGKVEDCFSFPL